MSSSLKDKLKTTTPTIAGDSLATSSISLHQRPEKDGNERQYVMSWTKGGVNDELKDDDSDPNTHYRIFFGSTRTWFEVRSE